MGRAVRDAFIKRADEQLSSGAVARALACLNRVLAEDHDDIDARALLARVQADSDGDGDGDGSALAGAAAGSNSGPPARARGAVNDEPASDPSENDGALSGIPALVQVRSSEDGDARAAFPSSAPSAPGRTAPARLARQLALVGAAGGLIAAAVIVATRFDDGRSTEPVEAREAGGDAPRVEQAGPNGGPAPAGPSGGTADPSARGGPKPGRVDGRVDREARPGTRRDEPRPATDVTAPRGATARVGGRTVVLRVKPWAEMFVDGKLVATGKRAEVELAVGTHVVAFRNVGARDAELRVDVPADGPIPEVAVELEPRPAYLTVRSNVPDAFVSVNGLGGKLAGETMGAPLLVPLGKESVARLEVIVHKKGYAPFVRRLDFVAGRTLELDVRLEPDAPRSGLPPAQPEAPPGAEP